MSTPVELVPCPCSDEGCGLAVLPSDAEKVLAARQAGVRAHADAADDETEAESARRHLLAMQGGLEGEVHRIANAGAEPACAEPDASYDENLRRYMAPRW